MLKHRYLDGEVDRWTDSRTKPQIFLLPKVEGRPKSPPFAFFLRHHATLFRKFLNSIKEFPLEFFEVFGW